MTSSPIKKKIKFENVRLRKAVEDDCLDILSWRNHPFIRKHSFNDEKISYPEHRKWFVEKLHDKDTTIFVAETKNLGKIGQVRFDTLNGRSARVNVNLGPAFLGRGFGPKIIAKGTRLFLKKNPKIRTIIAEILDENLAAKKAFQKADYVFLRDFLKNGRRASVYKFFK